MAPPKSSQNRAWTRTWTPAKPNLKEKMLRKRKFWAGSTMRRPKMEPKWLPNSNKIVENFKRVLHIVFKSIWEAFSTPKSFAKPFQKHAKSILKDMLFCNKFCSQIPSQKWYRACSCTTWKIEICVNFYSSFADLALCKQVSGIVAEAFGSVFIFLS